MTTKNQQCGASRRVFRIKSPSNQMKIISNQPPSYVPDKIQTYKVRYVPTADDYLWDLSLGTCAPFGVCYSTAALYNLYRYVRLKEVRMTLIFDPDVDLSSNFISAKFIPNNLSPQNGINGVEKLQYASAVQPAVITFKLGKNDPRGYFYDIGNHTGTPTLRMQTRKNCFIDLTWELIMYDGACLSSAITGATGTAGNLVTNQYSSSISTPGRGSVIWT